MPVTVARADTDTRFLIREMGARGIGHLPFASAPVEILWEAWQVVDRIRDWAEELSAAVEAELAAGRPEAAVQAWCFASLMLACMFLISALKPGRRTATDRAQSAANLLMVRDMLHRLNDQFPDAQRSVLDNPALMPDCVRPFLIPGSELTEH